MVRLLFDTHCHLDDGSFPEGADAVLERARAAGVGAFACIGVGSLDHAKKAVALAERHREVVATVGIHPHDAITWDASFEAELQALGGGERVVAIGEIGLDYHYDHSPREMQRSVFRRSIALARSLKKPIVVHTREAPDDTLAILRDEGAREVGGIIHCFSEDRAFAVRALDLGFYLSFSGILTFKNAKSVHDVAAWAPAERILIETDSPYLAPVPFRGKKCEPALVVHTAARLAEVRGLSGDELGELTTRNALAALHLSVGVVGGAVQLDTGRGGPP